MKKEIMLDASALRRSGCGLALKRLVIQGYRDLMPWNDTLYGTSFHKFVSLMHTTGGDFSKAMPEAIKTFSQPCMIRKKHLTVNHLTNTCIDYWEWFQKNDTFEVMIVDGKPLVEVQFKVKILETDEYIVWLVGTIDKVGKIKNGTYCFGDYKTTSSWDQITYFSYYWLSTQMLTYYYGLLKTAQEHPTGPLGPFATGRFSYFIDALFLSSAKKTEFKRSDIEPMDPAKIQEYESLLMNKAKRLIELASTDEEPIREGIITGSCLEGKFQCPFYVSCAAVDKVAGAHLLKRDFIKKPYDPFNFNSAD